MNEKKRGFCCVGLENPKDSINVGSVLRAAGVFGVELVAISGRRYSRARTDTMKAHRHLPMLQVDNLRDVIPYDCIPIAVEILPQSRSLVNFVHPERAFYIFGAEDATLGEKTLSWCKHVISISTNGCLNLAATVNVVLYDRMAKLGRK